jgi:enoyl-CoA hydratase
MMPSGLTCYTSSGLEKTMDDERIHIQMEKDIAILSINNPPANSLDKTTVQSLQAVIADFEERETPRVVVLTGNEKTFSAGADLRELAGAHLAKQAEEIVRRAKSLLDRIESFRRPVIAAINGPCLGGGLELALACHIRVADENSRFGFPEINLGLMPGAGGTQRLSQLVGLAGSCEMILTGELIDARRALRLGLINALAPAGSSLEIAGQIAQKIAVKSPQAVVSALEAIRCSKSPDPFEGMEKETRLFGRLVETDDARRRIAAFLAKT